MGVLSCNWKCSGILQEDSNFSNENCALYNFAGTQSNFKFIEQSLPDPNSHTSYFF